MSFFTSGFPAHPDRGVYLAGSVRPRIGPSTILVVDHDAAVRDALSLTLSASGFGVLTFPLAGALLGVLPIKRACCLLVEFDLIDMSGTALLDCMNERGFSLPAVLMSARLRPLVFKGTRPANVAVILQKPFGQEALLRCLRYALGKG